MKTNNNETSSEWYGTFIWSFRDCWWRSLNSLCLLCCTSLSLQHKTEDKRKTCYQLNTSNYLTKTRKLWHLVVILGEMVSLSSAINDSQMLGWSLAIVSRRNYYYFLKINLFFQPLRGLKTWRSRCRGERRTRNTTIRGIRGDQELFGNLVSQFPHYFCLKH